MITHIKLALHLLFSAASLSALLILVSFTLDGTAITLTIDKVTSYIALTILVASTVLHVIGVIKLLNK